jgi:hypothetical protein
MLKLYPESCVDMVRFGDRLDGLEKFAVSTDDTLNILIYGKNPGDSIPAQMESFLTVYRNDSEPEKILAAAAGYYGRHGEVSVNWPLPNKFELYQNYPNPFNTFTAISFDLATPSGWDVKVYNILGQEVHSFSGYDWPGTVVVGWDGTDNSGRNLASGIYFYKVTAGKHVESRKMVILK